MEFWDQHILPRLTNVEAIEWFTFAVNALVFFFSKKIASSYGQVKEEAKMRSRLRLLHGFNLVVFITFILSVAIKTDRLPDAPSTVVIEAQLEAAKKVFVASEIAARMEGAGEAEQNATATARAELDRLVKAKPETGGFRFPAAAISQTCLTLLLAYLLIHLAEALLLYRYGKEYTVMGFTRRVETSTSRTLELLAYAIISIGSIVVLVNVWDLTSSLQTTGLIGFLAVMVFTTKDYWMRDFLSGIILISSERLNRGDVIWLPKDNVLGIILEIRGMQTSIRDLVRQHDVLLPNSTLLNQRVDLYKENPGGPFWDFVDFKVSYGTAPETMERFLAAVFEKMSENRDAVDRERKPKIALKENGDHAARWRLSYVLSDPHQLLAVRDAVNLAAYTLQDEFGISVDTPSTHVVTVRGGSEASTSSSDAITGSASSS